MADCRVGNTWRNVSGAALYDSAWKDLDLMRVFRDGQWYDLFSNTPTSANEYVRTYNLYASQVYWNSGSKDTQTATAKSLVQGTWNVSASSSRRSLLIFDNALFDDINGATVNKVELYLMRESSTHGNAGNANVRIKSHGLRSLPATWNGADLGAACSTQLLKRGHGAWFELNSSVKAALGNTVFGFALDADTSTAMGDYCRFVRTGANAPKLRVTFTR